MKAVSLLVSSDLSKLESCERGIKKINGTEYREKKQYEKLAYDECGISNQERKNAQ